MSLLALGVSGGLLPCPEALMVLLITIAAHRVLPLSLTFDHRAATGGEAARFLMAVKTDLES